MGNENAAYSRLRRMKKFISKDQARIIKGQIRAGQIEGAMKGMDTILKRRTFFRSQNDFARKELGASHGKAEEGDRPKAV